MEKQDKYEIPVKMGSKVVKELYVSEIGKPLINEFTQDDALVPVRLSDGTYRILGCYGQEFHHFVSDNSEVNLLILGSSQMPTIRRGIGSDVWHVTVIDPKTGDHVLLKLFYNTKKIEYGRPDEVHR